MPPARQSVKPTSLGLPAELRGDGPSGSFTANYVWTPLTWLRAFAGVGATLYSINDSATSNPQDACTDVSGAHICKHKMEKGNVTPIVRAGLEWKPQKRVGLSAFGVYDLTATKITESLDVSTGPNTQTLPAWEFRLPRFYATTSIALYS